MKILQEMIHAIESQQKGSAQLGGKIKEFYFMILNGNIRDDKEAMNYFFDGNSTQYKILKYQLKNKLINKLLLMESNNENSEIQKARLLCEKNKVAIEFLKRKGNIISYTTLSEKTIRKAVKFEFIELALGLARPLKMHFSTIDFDKNKYWKYHELVDELKSKIDAEILIEDYFCQLYYKGSSSISSSKISSRQINKEELEKLFLGGQTRRFNIYYFYVLLSQYEKDFDTNGMIDICEKAILQFQQEKEYPISGVVVFSNILIGCSIQTKQFDKANRAIEGLEKILAPFKERNWAILMYYKILVNLYTGEFNNAFTIYKSVLTKMKTFTPSFVEQWKVIEAYLYFFVRVKKIDIKGSRFRLGKFLNEVPVLSKDKAGNNINILIIQILFFLADNKRDKLIDRSDAIKKYTSQYLKKEETKRCKIFIKMLLKISESNFHPVALQRKAKPYYDKLLASPFHKTRQMPEYEIVPYELLWGEVIGILRGQGKKVEGLVRK